MKSNTNLTVAALLLAIGFALSGYFIGHAITSAKRLDRYVTVKGLAEKTVKSDEAVWVISFNDANDSLGLLYANIAKAQQIVKAFLEAQGFKEGNIIFKPLSITDNLSNNYGNNANVKRYFATAGITLTTKEIDKAEEAVQKTGDLVKEGVVVSGSTVQYFYTDLNSIKPDMLVDATNNAKDAAESFAKNSHSNLGKIRNASQGLFAINDVSAVSNDYTSNASVMKKVRVVTTVQYYLQ